MLVIFRNHSVTLSVLKLSGFVVLCILIASESAEGKTLIMNKRFAKSELNGVYSLS